MVFHVSMLVLHGSTWFFIVPGCFYMVPGLFFMISHGSSLDFHGFRWVFMVYHGSRLVSMIFHGSRWVFMIFHAFMEKS